MVFTDDITHYCFQMWMWILIGLNIITKANGFASGDISESCESMIPKHGDGNGQPCAPQPTGCPFMVSYTHGEEGEPITGTQTIGPFLLKAKS